ncbi:MAG TPA: hypothetical protein ENG24_03610 [Thermoplasmatales archaeon]|nr:hypothetical protein [Thermoplasmatales archaeon]
MLLDIMHVRENEKVLDPCCGVGTTLLACREMGLKSLGFDVLPIAVFASTVKLSDYNVNVLKEYRKKITGAKFVKPDVSDVPNFVKRFFSNYALEDIYFLREEINKHVKNEMEKRFFMLALVNAALRCSYIKKDGAVLKIRKRKVPSLRYVYNRMLNKMIHDLYSNLEKTNAFVGYGDCRGLPLDDECIDVIITSPPYLNKTEYTKIFGIEHFLISDFYKPGLQKFFGLETHGKVELDFLDETLDLTKTAKFYLKDLSLMFKELYRVCNDNARVAIIIGDALVRRKILDMLSIASDIASYHGFRVSRITIANKRIATTPKRKKIGVLREGIIFLTR